MSKHYRKDKDCLNCGNYVADKFCSKCGQENVEIRESIWAFISHGVAHYFHYDSKFRNTLKPFITKPGQLTLDYLEGRRARYIPPVSLYLFITLVYFLLSPILTKQSNRPESKEEKEFISINKSGEEGLPISKSADSLLEAFKSKSYLDQLSEIRKLENTEKGDSDKELLKRGLISELKKINAKNPDSTVESYYSRQASLKPEQRDKAVERYWKAKKIKYRETHGVEFSRKEMDKYFSKLLFILMPMFAFFLKINFRRNKKFYIEYLIYTVHLFSFAYFTFLIRDIVQYILPSSVGKFAPLIMWVLVVWYIYRSIRVVYQRSRAVTIRKLFSLLFLFSLSLSLTYLLGMVFMLILA